MEVLWEEHIFDVWLLGQVVQWQEFIFEWFEPWFHGGLFGLNTALSTPVSIVVLILLAVTGHEFWF